MLSWKYCFLRPKRYFHRVSTQPSPTPKNETSCLRLHSALKADLNVHSQLISSLNTLMQENRRTWCIWHGTSRLHRTQTFGNACPLEGGSGRLNTPARALKALERRRGPQRTGLLFSKMNWASNANKPNSSLCVDESCNRGYIAWTAHLLAAWYAMFCWYPWEACLFQNRNGGRVDWGGGRGEGRGGREERRKRELF